MKPGVAVVISAWEGHPALVLRRLVNSMKRFAPGVPFDPVLSINGEGYDLPEDLAAVFRHVFRRENTGYNLGAWDHAWRHLAGYDYYLFLQDECFIRRGNWVRLFLQRFAGDRDCGLIGENLNPGWNHSWQDLIESESFSEKKRQRAMLYRQLLQQWGIPAGQTAAHLTSVVQFTARRILEEVDGYPIRNEHGEAVAAEIGFSRKIAAAGYSLHQLGRWRHQTIGHPQWPTEALWRKFRESLRPTAHRGRS
ncbi:MAG: hypothetical protein R2940_17330 [Syntrophotaleaceae bacterium]